MGKHEEEAEIDLLEVFFYLKKRFLVIFSTGVILAVLAGLGTEFLIVPTYSSTSKLYILSSSTSLTSLADIQIGSSLTKDFVQLVQSRPVADQVIANLQLDTTYEGLLKQMTFTNPSDTRILVITCEDHNPVLAKEIVNEFAEVSRVRISEIMKTDAPTIAEYGYVAEKPVSPSLKKNVAIGGLLGILIACAIYVVFYLIDDSVKTAEDIEKYLQINTLTSVPLREEEGSKKGFRRVKRKYQKESKGGKK